MHYGVIRNCSVSGTVQGENFTGGIVASNISGYILGCSFEGNVKTINDMEFKGGEEWAAGGIVGFSWTEGSGLVADCNVNATIESIHIAGGIVGMVYRVNNIFNCIFEGTVTGENYQDDLVGKIDK